MTTRGEDARARIAGIGISKREFADRAGLDRGTLERALANEANVSARTWARIENQLSTLEDELGMADGVGVVTATVTIGDVTVTVRGSASDVAEAVRRIVGA